MVVGGGGKVEGLDASGEPGEVLQAALLGRVVAALDLGDLDLPLAVGARQAALEVKVEGGGVAVALADVQVDVLAGVLPADGGDQLAGGGLEQDQGNWQHA